MKTLEAKVNHDIGTEIEIVAKHKVNTTMSNVTEQARLAVIEKKSIVSRRGTVGVRKKLDYSPSPDPRVESYLDA